MRAALLALAMTLPLMPAPAMAEAHSCNQLRQTVQLSVTGSARNLPYDALPCSAISEIYLLVTRHDSGTSFQLNQRIEAVFRRFGLVR